MLVIYYLRYVQSDCEADLAKVAPLLKEATLALDQLQPGDIVELKGIHHIKAGSEWLLQSHMHLLSKWKWFSRPFVFLRKFNPCALRAPKEMEVWWKTIGNLDMNHFSFISVYYSRESAKKTLLSDINLLKSLQTFETDDLPPTMMKMVGFLFFFGHHAIVGAKIYAQPRVGFDENKKSKQASLWACLLD